MRLVIGDYEAGKLTEAFHETGDAIPATVLQELKGRFTEDYRAANIRLTEEQLLAAATPDQDAIQAVHALAQLDIALNGLGKYTTEWHQLHHPGSTEPWPELSHKTLEEPGLREMNAAVRDLMKAREKVTDRLEEHMKVLLPNTTELVGGILAAKLLDHAGSVERLSRMPSNIIQLLGAEQALFRFLRSRDGRPPKHGVLLSHPLVQGVPARRRGAMARKLANAIAIAVRVDANNGERIAPKLLQRLEVQYNGIARS